MVMSFVVKLFRFVMPRWMEDSQAKKQKTKHNATLGSNFKIFYFVIVVNKIVIKKIKK